MLKFVEPVFCRAVRKFAATGCHGIGKHYLMDMQFCLSYDFSYHAISNWCTSICAIHYCMLWFSTFNLLFSARNSKSRTITNSTIGTKWFQIETTEIGMRRVQTQRINYYVNIIYRLSKKSTKTIKKL